MSLPQQNTDNIDKFIEFQLKLREFHQREMLDARKASTQFSKLILSNLCFINAGGLASLPVIATFLRLEQTATQRIELFLLPTVGFIFGLLLALLSAFFTYKNFSFWRDLAERNCDTDIASYTRGHAPENSEFRAQVEASLDKAKTRSEKAMGRVNWSYSLGMICGWLSMGLFCVSCVFLLFSRP
jgi:hypothetical protein